MNVATGCSLYFVSRGPGVRPLCAHKRPRAITSRHFEHETHRWYVVYYEYPVRHARQNYHEGYTKRNMERKRNRKNEKIRRVSKIKWNRKVWRETRDILGIPIGRPRRATNLKFTRLTFSRIHIYYSRKLAEHVSEITEILTRFKKSRMERDQVGSICIHNYMFYYILLYNVTMHVTLIVRYILGETRLIKFNYIYLFHTHKTMSLKILKSHVLI